VRGTSRRLDLRPAGVALLIAAVLLHVAWRSTGLRTLALARLGMIVVVGVNLLWAAVVAERTRVRATASTTDATVGEPVSVQVELRGPRAPVAVVTSWPGQGWVAAEAPATGSLTPVAPRRGLHRELDVTVACHHPFGLVGWVRTRPVALPHPLAVGPAVRPGHDAGAVRPDEQGAAGGHGDQVRGLRDYQPGDPARLVHWRASARSGQLVVKDLDGTIRPALLVGLDLSGGGEPAERAAGEAAGTCLEALARGWLVVLATVEEGGAATAPVTDRLAVQRRLAAAVAGAPRAPGGWRGPGVLLSGEGAHPWP
jgi:uncharacterized protein (DUF58 family)